VKRSALLAAALLIALGAFQAPGAAAAATAVRPDAMPQRVADAVTGTASVSGSGDSVLKANAITKKAAATILVLDWPGKII
jgi:hypothetical protein